MFQRDTCEEKNAIRQFFDEYFLQIFPLEMIKSLNVSTVTDNRAEVTQQV
jgi:hypothetical protein